MSWSRKFSEPIELSNGERLQDAIAWLAKSVPPLEHDTLEAHCVTEAAEGNGPMVFARIAMLKAINRNRPRQLAPSRKPHHWGKRKLGT